MADQPTLHTPRLVLRPFAPADAPAVEQLASAREVADTTLNIPHPYPAGTAAAFIEGRAAAWREGAGVAYAITSRETGGFLGGVGLHLTPRHRRAELGYWIGVPHWGCGYCTEAARVVLAFGFDALGLHRIEAHHFTRNPASGRVMQKLGMRFEGVHREAVIRWDRFEDLASYAILESDRR